MYVRHDPAPIGFVQEILVVANNLTMKEVKISDGLLTFIPKHNHKRAADGLARRLANRFHMADLVDLDRRYNEVNFDVNQDRLGQLIDLRGWPEITRFVLNVTIIVAWTKVDGYSVEVAFACEEHDDL